MCARSSDDAAVKTDVPYWRTNLFKRFAHDQKFLLVEWFPQEIKRPTFTAPIVAAIAIAANSKADGGGWDPKTQWEFASDRSSSQIQVAHGLTSIGNPQVVIAALGIGYLAARHRGDDHFAETASLAGEAIMNVGLYSIVLKTISARTRPGPGSEGAFFQWGQPRAGSFPSGHAMLAFSVATVFAEEYRQHKWAPWLAYGSATLIGVARVALGQHYPSDVLFGATLGHSMGEAVVARQGMNGGMWFDRLTPYYDDTHHGWGVAYSKHW